MDRLSDAHPFSSHAHVQGRRSGNFGRPTDLPLHPRQFASGSERRRRTEPFPYRRLGRWSRGEAPRLPHFRFAGAFALAISPSPAPSPPSPSPSTQPIARFPTNVLACACHRSGLGASSHQTGESRYLHMRVRRRHRGRGCPRLSIFRRDQVGRPRPDARRVGRYGSPRGRGLG